MIIGECPARFATASGFSPRLSEVET